MSLVDTFIPSHPGAVSSGDLIGGLQDLGSNFIHLRRPYLDKYDRACVTVNTGRSTLVKGERVPIREVHLIKELADKGWPLPLVCNAASLRKEEWIELDDKVIKAARERLRAFNDLAAANTYSFDGMSKMTLEYEVMSDPGEAMVDMEGVAMGRSDSPLFKLRSIPLPITHSDFTFSSRRLSVSRSSNTPLDTTMGEAAGRRVAELIEKTTLGTETGLSYGGQTAGVTAHDTSGSLGASKIYGYTNFPHRSTKTNMTVPTGTNPESTVSDVLTILDLLAANKFYGPWMVYHSTDWTKYLDNDYARLGGANANMTLRERLRKIEGIQDVRRVDFLTSTYTLIFVQMTADVARAVIGLPLTTVQWDTVGGMQKNFKVFTIMLPQLRSNYANQTGIMHATTAA